MKLSANNFSCITKRVKNFPHRLKREIYKIPPLQAFDNLVYRESLEAHAKLLPELDDLGRWIVTTLQQRGTCVIPIEELGFASTSKMMDTASFLAEKLKKSTTNPVASNECEVGSSPEDLREFTEILLWALEPKLLNIVENYIGLPILHQGHAMRKSLADGQYSGVRKWHIDWEDRRIIKIIIYLNDVVAEGGPYNYIERKKTLEAIKKLNYYNLGYISDEEMATAVHKSDWIACLGKAGSAIITDTSSVFHRAQPPTDYERFSITFCYTSTMPQVIWGGRKITPQQWEFIDRHTDRRQKQCIHKKRLAPFM